MGCCFSRPAARAQKAGQLSYQALDRSRKQIRLLNVLPGSGENPVRAKVAYEFLAEDQIDPYETVSYTWGDPKLRGEVEIDGSVIDVPASSAATLRCMRRPDTCRRVWIDAVCINQADIPERNSQVAMMGEIYRRSSHNLVYLGEEDASTQSAIASLRRALEELEKRPGTLEKFAQNVVHGGARLECEIDRASLAEFFERPWFSRMWVVQEAVLAPASTCYCGPQTRIDLLDLLRATSYIYGFDLRQNQGAWPKGSSSIGKCARLWPLVEPQGHRYVEMNEDRSSRRGNACWELMDLAKTRECFDPRDKIFSIVGLVDQARTKAPKENEADIALLEVDYKKPFEDVYRDATRYAIQESRNLQVWNNVSARINVETGDLVLEGLCSWVPRIHVPRTRIGKGIPTVTYRASAGLGISRNTMATALDPNVLSLEGYAIADVTEVTEPLAVDLFANNAHLAGTLSSIAHMCRRVVTEDPTRPSGFPEVLARTLTLSPYQGTAGDDDTFSSLQKHMDSVVDGDLENGDSGYWSEELMLTFTGACRNRRVFAGSDGHVGQGPRCLRVGDRIVVLLGGDVPFAVRPLPGGDGGSGERFQLLGSAYVYGVMYGECIDAAKARGKEPSTFHFV